MPAAAWPAGGTRGAGGTTLARRVAQVVRRHDLHPVLVEDVLDSGVQLVQRLGARPRILGAGRQTRRYSG